VCTPSYSVTSVPMVVCNAAVSPLQARATARLVSLNISIHPLEKKPSVVLAMSCAPRLARLRQRVRSTQWPVHIPTTSQQTARPSRCSRASRRLCSTGAARAAEAELDVWGGGEEEGPTASSRELDVVLSSGFLAFAAHAGFLSAVEEHSQRHGERVGGVMGTSAGALAGALFAAGYAPAELASVLRERPPLAYLSLNASQLWTGVFTLDGAVARLRELLPATFEELPLRFACGVVDARGRHVLVHSGPLPEAVAASAAVPCLFRPVHIPGLTGGPCACLPPHALAASCALALTPGTRTRCRAVADGGKVDRVGLRPWRRLGPQSTNRVVCHVIERSSPFSGDDDVERAAAESVGDRSRLVLVRSPRSRQSLAGLEAGTFERQFSAARSRAQLALGGGDAAAVRAAAQLQVASDTLW